MILDWFQAVVCMCAWIQHTFSMIALYHFLKLEFAVRWKIAAIDVVIGFVEVIFQAPQPSSSL